MKFKCAVDAVIAYADADTCQSLCFDWFDKIQSPAVDGRRQSLHWGAATKTACVNM